MSTERRLPVHKLSDVCLATAEEPRWLWRGYVAPGAISLLAGRPKVGKSTLLLALASASIKKEPFLGLATRPAPIVMLTEERADTIAEKARRFGLEGCDHLRIVYRHETLDWSWAEVVIASAELLGEQDSGLLVVDTLNNWAGLSDDAENRAGAWIETVQPLMAAAGRGVAVLATAHQRKSSGAYGEAVRGSNALPGSVEVVVELERTSFGESIRELAAVSRFQATPASLLCELSADQYVPLDRESVGRQGERTKVLAALERSGDWIDAQTVAHEAEVGLRTARERLNELAAEGLIEKTGDGVRGNPFLYRKRTSGCSSAGAEIKVAA
jgi:predicted ATP-dependent serine protease